jgi:predicted Zn-dependent peptidase
MGIVNDLGVQRFDATLDNGIRVVLLYRKGSPVTTSALLNPGSQYDPEHLPGMAHFIEHMIMNGSEKFPSKDVLAEHIESVGGGFGAKTNQEFLIVDTEVSGEEDFDRVVDMFDAILCRPLMDKKIFENEKKIVIKEIQKSLSNPSQLMWKAGRELFFKHTALEHNVLGDEQSIQAIQYEEMIAMHTQLFDASRITFVAAGDISIEKLVAGLSTLQFSAEYPFERKKIALPTAVVEKILTTIFDTPQSHIVFAVPCPNNFTKEMLQLSLIGGILAGGRSARLTKRLRYDKGLIYSVNAMRLGTTQRGQWGITTDSSEDKIQEVIDEIIQEIKLLQKNGIKESELEFVKNRTIKSMRRRLQTSKDWVDFYAAEEVFKGIPIDGIDKYIEIIEQTTTADLKNIIDTYFIPERWQLVLVGRNKPDSIVFNW